MDNATAARALYGTQPQGANSKAQAPERVQAALYDKSPTMPKPAAPAQQGKGSK